MLLDRNLSDFMLKKNSSSLNVFTLGLKGTSSWHAATKFS